VHHPRVGVGPPLLALLVVLPGLAVAPPALASPASGGSVRAPARAPAPIRPADVRGVYRVRGTARISARPLMDRDEEVYADATLEPGSGRDVRVALATEGERCTLVARLSDDGALAFADGQSCRLKLDGPDARGAVEARLVSGRGRAGGGRLALELALGLSGRVAIRTGGGRYEVLGREVEVPSAWAPEVPVSGDAAAKVEGWRDESRASDR
jgi:hypothetical protein